MTIFAAGFWGIESFTPPWDVFFLPLLNLLVVLYQVLFSDFALAIIVFTVLIRTLLAPLFVRQIRSSKEMQRMQPLVRELRRKHKGNAQKINEETMALYREHGVNPLSGCLPVLLQLPILFALYQALIRASGFIQGFAPANDNQAAFDAIQAAGLVEATGRANEFQAAFAGPCDLPQFSQLPQFLPLNCQLVEPLNLSAHIDTTIGWLANLDLARVDTVFAISIGGFALSALAVVAAILQFIQVKMTTPKPNSEDPAAAASTTMIYLFPLLTVFWGGLFPSGLILYWIVYTAYLVVQQYLIMGWGNLFPVFGWRPRFAPSPEAGFVSSSPRERATEPQVSLEPTGTRSGATGSRGASRSANRRSGNAKRRGRRR